MKMQLTGQFIPGNSFVHRLDARAKLFGFLFLLAAVIIAKPIYGYIIMVALVFAVITCSGFSIEIALGSIRRMGKFFVLIFLLNALFFSTQDTYWQWWIFSLSKEGLLQGVNVVFQVVLIMTLSNVLTLSTPPMELVSAIEALIYPLRFIRVPVEDVAIILSVAIQFIPTLLEETAIIRKAQTARGARFESKKRRERAMSLLPLVVPVFLSAFNRADELSVAMEARGYRGAKYRTEKDKRPLNISSWLSMLGCSLICALQIILLQI